MKKEKYVRRTFYIQAEAAKEIRKRAKQRKITESAVVRELFVK